MSPMERYTVSPGDTSFSSITLLDRSSALGSDASRFKYSLMWWGKSPFRNQQVRPNSSGTTPIRVSPLTRLELAIREVFFTVSTRAAEETVFICSYLVNRGSV